MLRDQDELDDPDYQCPVCRRSFHSYARLDDHMDGARGTEAVPQLRQAAARGRISQMLRREALSGQGREVTQGKTLIDGAKFIQSRLGAFAGFH